ncbi:hypothetical protein MUB24_17645 [Lederbergia sp. NSJ-179]|uniref:hypothetical protein n=1 Tax=Lederbergia sp. NSJ-179 TaxID=2931402 RepID=UPI001FD621B7|nr:hypothetical protein [Lederbergia sp. NSJ-179]MCJ7842689.1 hypothetical protein [Lederbergia sp. NSJ-179]
MDQRKLIAWQPIKHLEKGQITNAHFNFTDHGLYLKLIDIHGNAVDIIYDKMSNMYDFVWSFRYAGEIPRTDLTNLVVEAEDENYIDPAAACFYKMENSDFVVWFDQLGYMGSDDFPDVEHHLFMYNDGVFEVISDYEPKFIVHHK